MYRDWKHECWRGGRLDPGSSPGWQRGNGFCRISDAPPAKPEASNIWTAQSGLNCWTTERWLFLKHTQLIQTTIFLLLWPDVLPDGRFIYPNGGNIIPSGPKMLASKILTMTHIISRYMNRTLSFDETDHMCHCIFRRYRDHHMNMIGSKMSLQYLTFLLCCETPECWSQIPAQLIIKRFPSIFRYPHHMILAFPWSMA